MQYLRDLFGKGKYHIYIGFALLIECQRNYMLPKTKLYANIKNKAIQQLNYIDSQNDHKDVVLETMSNEDQNKLKTQTKKKIIQIQNLSKISGSTTLITSSILGMGAINYFLSPTACAIFVSSYLTLLVADFVKSMVVIRFGMQPLWRWKMQNVGYLMAYSFAFFTVIVGTKTGFAKIKERASRGLVVKEEVGMPDKKD